MKMTVGELLRRLTHYDLSHEVQIEYPVDTGVYNATNNVELSADVIEGILHICVGVGGDEG